MAFESLRIRILGHRDQAVDETVRRQAACFQAMPELCELLDTLPHPLLILNEKRQIVFSNRALLDLFGPIEPDLALGLRSGQVLNCEHAWGPGPGCGATEACQTCGAHRAIDLCQLGNQAVQECRIMQADGMALDLRVNSTPLKLGGGSFTVLALTDIGHEKRRRVLERVFYHDLLNITAGIMGYAELLSRVLPEEIPELSRLMTRLVRDLTEEIRSHRDLTLAETQDLAVHWEPVNTRKVLAGAMETCRTMEAAQGRSIVLDPANADAVFPSDRQLLARVLGNMLKNALEASPPDGVVTVGVTSDDERIEFWVHNEGFMPREVQSQVFHRSFSTKGPGRGLGTYSIKLLTERYLEGRASFTSTSQAGTTFTVSYPRIRNERG